ncbi:hypothetical protein LTR99_008960 [Exophiala xenobiotica]|uniref:BTB domain-containing protein n=1 Tax=Vermiconidia calcicola TaxID=1690605 RepID=A0AAV9Q3A1_9PEZI|nr:hypothetical protein LTR92_000706 [Exophiala xenobiotica]KAK5528807.1 hypothetical protein LTR23_010903 [Chaetothyriales sp. CCFEE 6169]KAK5532228.1 hypothetical protein LTR25_007760 [Vermiconidia calcicola]KAK5265856.1 hypothetical protein LTR96_008756 [Exophiala xenobiotica]KAK5295372.1 hypothetical protein LTR99_008960 [Exophiala xenobiotica]
MSGRFPPTDAPCVSSGAAMVKVVIGKSDPPYVKTIHADLLCKTSWFFKGALRSLFAEGQTKVVKLPNEEPEVFDGLCDWLYGKHPGMVSSKIRRTRENSKNWKKGWFERSAQILVRGIEGIFNALTAVKPHIDFIHAMLDEELPDSANVVRMYVLHHCAHWNIVVSGMSNWPFTDATDDDPVTMAMLSLLKRSPVTFPLRGVMKHPSSNALFPFVHNFDINRLGEQAQALVEGPERHVAALKIMHLDKESKDQ